MRAIIPAKTSSKRVPDKNWRPFHNQSSLVDINIEALLNAGLDAADIYVSCEDAERLERLNKRWGVTPILCSAELCSNGISFGDWIRWTCAQVPGDDDLIWSQVCDPLFDEYHEVLDSWPDAKAHGYDSICVVYPHKAYLLDECFRPIGWQWGEWHTTGQNLPQFYTFPFTLSILTRDAIDRTGYHIGARPSWYVSRGDSIDIDTQADFGLARHLFEEKQNVP
jgi:N-acylneuraminate cytidylyltransferase